MENLADAVERTSAEVTGEPDIYGLGCESQYTSSSVCGLSLATTRCIVLIFLTPFLTPKDRHIEKSRKKKRMTALNMEGIVLNP